jgi:hypothetical protein
VLYYFGPVFDYGVCAVLTLGRLKSQRSCCRIQAAP